MSTTPHTSFDEAMDPQLMVKMAGEAGALPEVADQATARPQSAIGALG